MVVGKFLYYGRAIETPILVALNEIGTQQAAPTKNTNKAATWLMDFLAWHPDGKVRYYAGNMQLAVDYLPFPFFLLVDVRAIRRGSLLAFAFDNSS